MEIDDEKADYLAECPPSDKIQDHADGEQNGVEYSGDDETEVKSLKTNQEATKSTENVNTVQYEQSLKQETRAITRSQQPEVKNSQLLIGWEPSDIRQLQLSDENIGPIMTAKETDNVKPVWERISKGAQLKTLWSQWDRLELCGGILYRKWESDVNRDSKLQLILPRDKRKEVLRYCHDIPTAGHLGVEKTVKSKKISIGHV